MRIHIIIEGDGLSADEAGSSAVGSSDRVVHDPKAELERRHLHPYLDGICAFLDEWDAGAPDSAPRGKAGGLEGRLERTDDDGEPHLHISFAGLEQQFNDAGPRRAAGDHGLHEETDVLPWSPVRACESADDCLEVSRAIVSQTESPFGTGGQDGDPTWERGETMLLFSLVEYARQELPAPSRTLTGIMGLLDVYEGPEEEGDLSLEAPVHNFDLCMLDAASCGDLDAGCYLSCWRAWRMLPPFTRESMVAELKLKLAECIDDGADE